jgi:heat shock protein 4
MSVVGIDFGNANSRVALARRKGIDVVLNDESKRETPSMLNFGEKQVRVVCSTCVRVRVDEDEMKMKMKTTGLESSGRTRWGCV